MHFHIFILFRFLCNKRCSNVIFRVLDEKPTHNMYYDAKWPKSAIWPHDLRWPWPQKRSPRAKDDAQMSQTRIMSINRLLMRLFPAFCLGKALNGNVKHFVFDLTCDVTGDIEVKFLNLIWKISSRPFHCRLNFPLRLLVSEIDGGAATAPPPSSG